MLTLHLVRLFAICMLCVPAALILTAITSDDARSDKDIDSACIVFYIMCVCVGVGTYLLTI
jgi:hypothetical protein